MTDAMKAFGQLDVRYADLVLEREQKQESRSAEEIIGNVKSKIKKVSES